MTDPYVARGLSAIERFLASSDAMELLPKEITHDLSTLDRHPHAQPDTGWAHRIPVGNPPRRAAREGRVMVMWGTPPIREPWPQTASEWEMHALCSQLRADHRRQEAWEERQEFRREIAAMLKGAGTVLGCLVVMALCWALAWGMAAL